VWRGGGRRETTTLNTVSDTAAIMAAEASLRGRENKARRTIRSEQKRGSKRADASKPLNLKHLRLRVTEGVPINSTLSLSGTSALRPSWKHLRLAPQPCAGSPAALAGM